MVYPSHVVARTCRTYGTQIPDSLGGGVVVSHMSWCGDVKWPCGNAGSILLKHSVSTCYCELGLCASGARAHVGVGWSRCAAGLGASVRYPGKHVRWCRDPHETSSLAKEKPTPLHAVAAVLAGTVSIRTSLWEQGVRRRRVHGWGRVRPVRRTRLPTRATPAKLLQSISQYAYGMYAQGMYA